MVGDSFLFHVRPIDLDRELLADHGKLNLVALQARQFQLHVHRVFRFPDVHPGAPPGPQRPGHVAHSTQEPIEKTIHFSSKLVDGVSRTDVTEYHVAILLLLMFWASHILPGRASGQRRWAGHRCRHVQAAWKQASAKTVPKASP